MLKYNVLQLCILHNTFLSSQRHLLPALFGQLLSGAFSKLPQSIIIPAS